MEQFASGILKVEEGKKLVKNCKNELKRYRVVNTEVLKALKKVSLNFVDLSTKYVEANELFDYITISERIELDYQMKMTKDFTIDNVSSLLSKFVSYYEVAEKRIASIQKLLKLSIERLG